MTRGLKPWHWRALEKDEQQAAKLPSSRRHAVTRTSFFPSKHLAQSGLVIHICGLTALVALLGKDGLTYYTLLQKA